MNKEEIMAMILGVILLIIFWSPITNYRDKLYPKPEPKEVINSSPFYLTYNTKKETVTLTHKADCSVEYKSSTTSGEFGKVKVSCPEFLTDNLVVRGNK